MEKKEIAKLINKDIKTLYNWEKNNTLLYKAVNEYFCKRENNPLENKILELFEKLDEKEKKYYIADMEARILKKEIN
ncbi:TPA: TetR/AcrR family transcriptional regulator [Campylobacter jejuni]|nr:histidine kinase [Campylobacter jejuni]HEF7719084.1 TetR/AcrR family transcriptional regulator [Campylobacter jejuni]